MIHGTVPKSRDIYERSTTSNSRGKTQQRIMDLQRSDGTLPGGDELLAERPEGSIAEGLYSFLRNWVEQQSVTSRRAYERTIVLLARDIAGDSEGALLQPATSLAPQRLTAHLDWRKTHGLTDPAEMRRACVHMNRFATWLNEHRATALDVSREQLREHADVLLRP
jgi:hypothetical protein